MAAKRRQETIVGIMAAAVCSAAVTSAASLAGCKNSPGTAPAPGIPGGGGFAFNVPPAQAPAATPGTPVQDAFWSRWKGTYKKGARWGYTTTTKIVGPGEPQTFVSDSTQEVVDVTATEARIRTTTTVNGQTSSSEQTIKLNEPPKLDRDPVPAGDPGAKVKVKMEATHMGPETVTVPAGTFPSAKIRFAADDAPHTTNYMWFNNDVGLVKMQVETNGEGVSSSVVMELKEFRKGA